MRTHIKINYKIILTSVGLLFVGIVIAFIFEDFYRQLVRFLFNFFNGDKIQFFGKNFHLFASNRFIIAFGLFVSLIYVILKISSRPKRLKRASLTVIVFFATTILITALDSSRLIIECTACNDGIRKLYYNEITYDEYFIISLTTASVYLFTAYLLERKKITIYAYPLYSLNIINFVQTDKL